ncbi:hypothetical protein ACFSL6_17120 [Paenibacillus thailandensis]|uniref:Transcriptional regulator n=1 Tax=Paenibacillus thailandensis TaxID=393250 RepID=A0ABW5QZK7_9BACL
MDKFSPEVKAIIERLEIHRRKKEEILKQGNITQEVRSDSIGRVAALSHAITELQHLYQTGQVKPDKDDIN